MKITLVALNAWIPIQNRIKTKHRMKIKQKTEKKTRRKIKENLKLNSHIVLKLIKSQCLILITMQNKYSNEAMTPRQILTRSPREYRPLVLFFFSLSSLSLFFCIHPNSWHCIFDIYLAVLFHTNGECSSLYHAIADRIGKANGQLCVISNSFQQNNFS